MEKAETVSKEFPRMIIRYNVPMREYTTLHLGGNADVMAEPASQEELSALLAFCEKENIPVSVIGHGSNLLVRDGGIRGVVILIGRGMSHAEVSDAEIRAEAGISLASLSQLACENSLTGCEFMSGIPGTLGGGIVMNAGAYGGEMSQVITRVQAVDYSGREVTLQGDELDFSYRHSAFSQGKMIVTEASLALTPGDKGEIRAKMAELSAKRREKQPVEKHSCGSTFKRPPEGYAARMIDECGLMGFRVGGASVSEKHAGFLINEGNSAADYMELMEIVRSRVREKFGVTLENEVQIIGEERQI